MSKAHKAINETQWQWLRRRTFERADYACQKCGDRGKRLECDHIIPLCDGGKTRLDNLQALCRDCHIAKTRAERGLDYHGGAEWAEFVHAPRYRRARPA
ncbi:MAG: HNH endonuclease [Gemmatimonadetes bacterium]|nr:HNH endonuclease [Gemmatimonadota bacterium]